ncbi:thioester-containing protein 1 allele R1-like [Musca vetustissima]|uniref:thioester-containing protein 1 allele R1-like n=1 Tax=Musca vetustissima TaxID=27455 RepID=UPI002AB5F0F6|nr:thioester-containing protein 1 allele R1-like [Musca vetustissima]
MQYFLINIAILLGRFLFVTSQSYYSVVSPGYIKSNRNYTVFVNLHQSSEPVKINVIIEGPAFRLQKDMFLKPFESKAITFLPPKLSEGDHKLIVEGLSGMRFRNESGLIAFPDAGPKIYIQTDKAVYKPGDVVQFRVVLLDEHTRPLRVSEPIRVDIMSSLQYDVSRVPFLALVYPGLLSGVITMTNAHYEFVPLLETWIFENYEITNDTTQLTLQIPDTITTWRITAFTVNEKTGFGIVDGPTDITKNKWIPSVATISFFINPRHIGEITLKITATNLRANDAIIQKLRVEPEGILKEFNTAQYCNVTPNEPRDLIIPLTIDEHIVPESEFITLSVVGDQMVSVLENLNDLLNLPTGCGEQNMAKLAPNVLVLLYLKSTGEYHRQSKLVAKAKQYIEVGYQQQLTYRHKNGGYSLFGQRKDAEPSTWLTAYTTRFFIKSQKYITTIEKQVIGNDLDYLAKTQRDDGSFPYTGYLIYPAQQNRFGLTAFVLMTFLEDSKFGRKYSAVIEKGLRFLHDNVDRINDAYALSIVAVTLQMAGKYDNSKIILDKLMKYKKSADDSIWWSQSDRNSAKDVEITGYVLMALLTTGYSEEDSKKAFKWLEKQRNYKGGFKSSQDTVVGLQALVQHSIKYKVSGNVNVRVNYTSFGEDKGVVKAGEMIVDENNIKVLQTKELPKSTRNMEIRVSGMGNIFLQFYYHYYIADRDSFQYFQIEPKVELLNPGELSLEICFSFIGANATSTNMVVMEVNLPSGFSADEKDIDDLLEMKNSATNVIVYTNGIMAAEMNCFNMMAYKLHDLLFDSSP